MSIPIKIRDNTSTVKVKSNSSDNIKVKSNCDIEKTRLDSLIKEEKEERIEADENLQSQIYNKQDKIEFIIITNISGVIDRELLNYLIDNRVNRLVFNSVIYYLSFQTGNIRKYFSTNQSSTFNEIDVNMETGEYQVISKLDPAIKEHIENTRIHITEEERVFWNNKVTSYLDEENVENLVLTKN